MLLMNYKSVIRDFAFINTDTYSHSSIATYPINLFPLFSPNRTRQTNAAIRQQNNSDCQPEQLAQRRLPYHLLRHPIQDVRSPRVDTGQQQHYTRTADHHHHGSHFWRVVQSADDGQE